MDIDSLVAVELRGWFVKTLQVNISVLRILSGSSLADLVDVAVETIRRSLVSRFDEEGGGGSDAPPEVVKEQDQQQKPPVQREVDVEVEPPSQQTPEPGNWSFLSERQQAEETTTAIKIKTIVAAESESSLEPQNGKVTIVVEHPASEDGESNTYSQYHTTSNSETEGSGSLKGTYTPVTPFEEEENERQLFRARAPSPTRTPDIIIDEKVVDLFFSQSLFWFSVAFSDNPSNINLTGAFRLTGEISVEGLKRAVLALGQQHEFLRSRFLVGDDDKPKQGVMKSTLEHHTIQHESELAKHADEMHNHV